MTDAAIDHLTDIDPQRASPEDVTPDQLRAGLQTDDNLDRVHAAKVLAVVANEDPEIARQIVPTIVDGLDDERTVVVRESAGVLAVLAEERPEDLEGHLEAVLDLFDHRLPLVQAMGAQVVRSLAVERPEWFVPHADRLLSVLEAEVVDPTDGVDPSDVDQPGMSERIAEVSKEEQQRQVATKTIVGNVVVEIADRDPDALRDHADRVVDLLDHSSGGVVSSAAATLATLAEAHPEAVADGVDELCSALELPGEATRANAVAALGYVGDPAAVGPLRDLADDEEAEDDVRELARETADFLEEQAD